MAKSDPTEVIPLTIGPRNCEAAIGQNWRWARDFAVRVGVPIWRVGTKSLIPAQPLLQALEREAAKPPPRELTEEEERDAFLARIGYRMKTPAELAPDESEDAILARMGMRRVRR